MKESAKITKFIEKNLNPDKSEPKKSNLPAKKPLKSEILNEKQREFVRLIVVEGMTPLDSYMAVYKVSSRKIGSNGCYTLLKREHIKAELASQSNQLKALSHVPKHYLIKKVKALLEICEADLNDAGNRKYYIECLDMINKMSGNYENNKTVTNINLSGGIDFGGFNPDSTTPIDTTFIEMTQSDEAKPLDEESSDEEGENDWNPESDETMPF